MTSGPLCRLIDISLETSDFFHRTVKTPKFKENAKLGCVFFSPFLFKQFQKLAYHIFSNLP